METGDEKKEKEGGRLQPSKNKLDDGEERPQGTKRKKISQDNFMNRAISGRAGMENTSACDPASQPSVNQLQEEIHSKQLMIEALQHDNHQRQNENSVSAANAKKIIEHYKEKLQEYQAAVNQRDQMISQLRTRLAECIQSQDDLQAEIHQQTETSTREIETLKLQLKETTESLNKNWTTGINPHEHLELKNKLISIQQDRSQDQQLREQLYMQLSVKKEQYGHLDSKYKHSLQKFKETQMNIEKLTHELKANKEITEILQGENETLIARIQELGDSHRVEIEEQTLKWSAEKKALIEQDRIKDEQINKIENEIKTLTENMKAAENLSDHKLKEIKDKTEKMIERERLGKEKSSCEIQNLMQQLQELTREITHTKEQHQTQLITAEEQFGQQLAVMKQQMSERHNEELLRIKASHESEVAQVTQQIDALEKAQKEDHTSLIENLNSLNNLNINLKEQLEGEKEKLHTLEASLCELRKEKEHLRAEVEGSKERERDLQLELKQEVDTKNDLQQKSEEQRRRYVEIENLVQNLKTETERVKEDLKIETEKRSSNENLLALELQNVKDLSTKKINLEEKLANISQEMNVMCNELSQSKTSKDDLNARFQKAQQRYNEVSYELEEYKKTAKEQELKCQKLRREMKIWLTEKESITAELEQCITILKSEIVKIEKNAKYTTELEKEISLFKHENEELHKRCEKLAQYEQECQILNEKLGQKYSDLKKSEDSHDLREKFLALFDQCQSIELTRKKIETECEEKCECLNDKLQSLDSKLAEASGLCGKFYDISNHSTSVEKKLQDVIQRLKEAEDNIGDREEALMKATFEKDALISEIKQTKIAHDSMEKEKNECEMDRDRMLEQYKMMKAELASTLLALDREVQLSTHRKLTSDVGISVSTSTSFEHSAVQGEFSIDSDQHHLEKDAEKEMVVEKVNVSARIMIKPQENKGNEKFNKILEDRIHNLEKENKELLNEVKKLNTKVHDQHFSVKSLENEKSNLRRRLTEWESEKVKFRAEQEIYEKEMSEKLDLKKQLKEVKLTVHLTEDNLKRQEEEMNCLRKSLKALVERDNSECLVRLNKIVNSFEISSGKTRLQESSNCTAYLKTYLSKQSEEIECMCEELKKYLCKLMELQQHSDKLSEEKLKTELENISLKFEVEKLKSLQSCVEGHEPQSRETDYTPSEVTSPRTEGDGGDLHRELKNYKHENEKLRLDIEKLKTLFKLEKLHMQSTRLNSQKEADKSMGKKELIITHIGTKLEELIEEWDNQVKIDPLLAEFISTQTCKVCDILQKLPGSLSESSDSEAYVDAAIRLIQQAIIKNVSGQYLEDVKSLLIELDEDITKALRVSLPALFTDTSTNASLSQDCTDINTVPTQGDDVKTFTDKVEHLINIRNTLVEAANEFEEHLEEAVTLRLSCIKRELYDLTKLTAIKLTAKDSEESTKTSSISEDLTTQLETQQQFIHEFMDITTNINLDAQSEKMKILKNQEMMVHKILEDNKEKLHFVCQEHMEDMKNVSSLSDAIKYSSELMLSLEKTLSDEVSWVEQQYKELLEQYNYEQTLHTQSRSLTLEELKNRLIVLLRGTATQTELDDLKSHQKCELMKLQEEHGAEVQRLERQLAVRDQETLLEDANDELHKIIDPATDVNSVLFQRHLQSLYSDRDWYKKTVGLLSHVTLQLLHYYSVAESYTNKPQDHKVINEIIEDQSAMHQPELFSGRVLDLSFLSDSMPDDSYTSQLNMFAEDTALSTGLISKTIYTDQGDEPELVSNSGSVLDSTAMSEGMLDDVDKDEQVRSILTKSYPQLMSILKGRWDRVVVENLEKEVQELTISLQASAGMLKIFLHSVSSENQDLSSHTIREVTQDDSVKETVSDLSQHHLSETIEALSKTPGDEVQPNKSIRESESSCSTVSLKIHNVRKKFMKNLKDTEVDLPLKEDALDVTSQSSQSELFKELTQLDLVNLSESLTILLSQDESFINFTKLKHQELIDEEKLKEVLKQLCQNVQFTACLQMKLHHVEGLLKGLEEEKKTLEDENCRLNHYSKNLAMELQVVKDQIEELEAVQQDQEGGTACTQYAAKMEASKDIKERVRATLSAKNKSLMDHTELVARVGDLEGILETLVRENDATVEALKSRVSDLSQQLEVADRQLRSSRQFLEEHASERDQEMEDLMHTKDKLASQLREKDALLVQHANLEKEVENLERQLREKSQELQDALTSKEEIQVEHKAAVDKIWDLREIIQSLEAQVDGKCVEESNLNTQVETLTAALSLAHQDSQDLTSKLEALQCGGSIQGGGHSREQLPTQGPRTVEPEEEENDAQLTGTSLFMELRDEYRQGTRNVSGQTLLQIIEETVERTTSGLEALQLSVSSASQSAEDLSIQDHLDVPSLQERENNRALSPASVDRRLEDKLLTLERTTEAAVKRTRDLEMTLKNLRVDHEEVTAERDVLQEHSKEQLVQISSLEARLDEIRRSEHPMTAELRQRLNFVQENLEKKRNEITKKGREIEELKHNLTSTRGKLMSREEELERMQCVSQPHSLPLSTADQLLTKQRHLEDELATKYIIIEKLKKELVDASKSDTIPPLLAQSLIEDKNAEISELYQQLRNMKSRVHEVVTFIANGTSLAECKNMLQKIIGDDKFSPRLSDAEAPEVLRKTLVQDSDLTSYSSLTSHVISSLKEGPCPFIISNSKSEDGVSFITQPSSGNLTLMSLQHEAPHEISKTSSSHTSMTFKIPPLHKDDRLETSSPSVGGAGTSADEEIKEMVEEEKAAPHTSPFEEGIPFTKEEYESLCSASGEVTVLRAQIELMQKEIDNLNKYQAKLEEDYKVAQEMLEAREEEITQLSEEIEDTGSLPLPSQTLHMQDMCFRLEEQVVELQERFNEAAAMNREYEEEIEKLNLRTSQYEQEIKELQEGIELLRKEDKQKEVLLLEKETSLQETRREIDKNVDQHKQKQMELCREMKVLHEQMEQLKQQHEEQSAALQRKTEEVAQLSAQLDLVHSEMKERLSHTNKEMAQLEEQYQQEISDMKEEQILREKQLCSDYEERMAAQVSDLSVKLGRDKEEAVARQQRFYKSALHEANREKERVQMELQEQRRAVDFHNRSQQTSHLFDSVDALNAGVKLELDKSGQLDNSLVSFVKHGHTRGDPGDLSTRASSAVSDISDGDGPSDIAVKVQRLMNKVDKEGIEMLTLIELMFLQKHQTHLDNSQRTLISQSGFIATGSTESSIADIQERSAQSVQGKTEDGVTVGERTQLLRHMAALEEELSKKDQEIKRKVNLLEFRLEQEKKLGIEWKLSFESEKKRARELIEQLREEKLASADRVSELKILRSQFFVQRLELQKIQGESSSVNETLETNEKEVEMLKDALQAERNNFSRVSKALNQQRHLAAVTRSQQDGVIKDLRCTLDSERERIMDLYTQLAELTNQQANKQCDRRGIITRRMESERITSGVKETTTAITPTVEDLQMQLAVEKERFTELQRSYERERRKVVTQNEQAHAERACAKVELMEEQGKCAELTKTIRNMEMEKDTLLRQMSQNRERLQHQESRIREMEAEIRKLEGDLRAQADGHQAASHRVREEDAQLHINYTRSLNKLGEAEAELCTLRHKLRTVTKDLELSKEKEEQLQQELTTEKMAINRLGLPALARINNLDEYFELQLKENLELCKSVLRLTDDRQAMRQKIDTLENTVTDLTEQLIKTKAAASNHVDFEKMLQMERSAWEKERTSLQNIISRKDIEMTRLQIEAGSRNTLQNVNNAQLDDERVQYMYGKYVRSEHWRKALIWQKRYLLVVIKGYRDDEQATLSRLRNMASQVHGAVRNEAVEAADNAVHPKHRFRVGALAMVAICRMKNMVLKHQRRKRLGSQILLPYPHTALTIPSTPDASESSRPGSANQGVLGGGMSYVTLQTPPTKGPSNNIWPRPSSSRRNLFLEEESPRLNEYIERLDNIHSALGLNPKNI